MNCNVMKLAREGATQITIEMPSAGLVHVAARYQISWTGVHPAISSIFFLQYASCFSLAIVFASFGVVFAPQRGVVIVRNIRCKFRAF